MFGLKADDTHRAWGVLRFLLRSWGRCHEHSASRKSSYIPGVHASLQPKVQRGSSKRLQGLVLGGSEVRASVTWDNVLRANAVLSGMAFKAKTACRTGCSLEAISYIVTFTSTCTTVAAPMTMITIACVSCYGIT